MDYILCCYDYDYGSIFNVAQRPYNVCPCVARRSWRLERRSDNSFYLWRQIELLIVVVATPILPNAISCLLGSHLVVT